MSAQAEPAPMDVGAWLRRLRGPAAFVAVGLALVALLAVVGRSPNSTALDPRNPEPNGTRALAALLHDRGDAVRVVDRVEGLSMQAADTIVLSSPAAVSDDALRELAASRSSLVVLEPRDRELTALGIDARFDAIISDTETLSPQCTLPAAEVAGTARISGNLYRTTPVSAGITACYSAQGDASVLAAARPNGGRTVVVGSAATFTNAHLAAEGDAALALGLLDSPSVYWAPGPLQAEAAPGPEHGLFNLLPSRLLWATLQLFLAVVLLALWRARRLGPLVAEPLPVVVRAAETTEGSGRLLHAARARDGAAQALRAATLGRLQRSLRIPPDDAPSAITPVVAERSGRPAATVNTLLYGGEPGDDAALVQLARDLASLESAVSRDMHPGGQR